MKQQSSSSKLSMHQDSRLISKLKPPKIRIIHIVAPEIINTDTANFRELVQALTGKPPSGGDHVQCSSINKSSKVPEINKEDEDDSSNDFLNDLDGFIQHISPHQFPFMTKSPHFHHMGVFGDHPQIYQ